MKTEKLIPKEERFLSHLPCICSFIINSNVIMFVVDLMLVAADDAVDVG